jgi:hypothetical protein
MVERSKETYQILNDTLKTEEANYTSCFNTFVKKSTISLEGSGKYGFRCSVSKEGWAIVRLEAPPYTIDYFFSEQPK